MSKEILIEQGKLAQEAARKLGQMSSEKKNEILQAMARALKDRCDYILDCNDLDLKEARGKNASNAFIDRLTLSPDRIEDMSKGIMTLVELKDPVGELISGWRAAKGININKVRVPLGVVGIIYEARPNVTADVAGICLKTGNSVLLRGSRDAFESNRAIVKVLCEAAERCGAPHGAIQLVEDTSRETAEAMMKLNKYIDVLIPRGGAGLIRNVLENATVPVIETGTGNCHIYVDETADLNMACSIVINAKTQRPGVCNAAETLLVHRGIAAEFLPMVCKALQEKGVLIKGCPDCCKLVPELTPATEEDYETEFLDMIIAVKIVEDLDAALEHIHQYGTKHSEAIITNDYTKANIFTEQVDAAAVYVNASTRFTDGGQFGFGAEMGISTQKLHARGPMGLQEMTTIKYIIHGQGQIRG
jgi:glutamate-5-semialdehyde dehydrogenase